MTETKLEKKTLREWRAEAGLTQRELAELAGCNKSAVTWLETGRFSWGAPSLRKVAAALDIDMSQVEVSKPLRIDTSWWPDDGFRESTPRQSLKWWRERRSLTQEELALLAKLSPGRVLKIENGRTGKQTWPQTRRALAAALRIAPDKLILPGDDVKPERAQIVEDVLRSELRGARRICRRWIDATNDGRYLTNRAYDDLASLIEDTERELRGT